MKCISEKKSFELNAFPMIESLHRMIDENVHTG